MSNVPMRRSKPSGSGASSAYCTDTVNGWALKNVSILALGTAQPRSNRGDVTVSPSFSHETVTP